MFGTELRAVMAERGVGVRELARRTGYTPGYVSNVRSGIKASSPRVAGLMDAALEAGGRLVEADRRAAAGSATRPSGQGAKAAAAQAAIPGEAQAASPEQQGREPSTRELRRALGSKLKAARAGAGWSQRQLAHKIGYTRSGVSSAESGGYAQRSFYERCDAALGTGGALAGDYDVISGRRAAERVQCTRAEAEFGEPGMKVVVGYVRGAWHVEVHLPERGG
jgi:transcriptional regulator with XRE-family HTH domain